MDLALSVSTGPMFPRAASLPLAPPGRAGGASDEDGGPDFSTRRRDVDKTPPLCSLCIDGGTLIICDGLCKRSFHLECLGMTEKQVCLTVCAAVRLCGCASASASACACASASACGRASASEYAVLIWCHVLCEAGEEAGGT
jgi:hypothetical protein